MTKFLITGGLGFIGSIVADKLSDMDHEVRIVDNISKGDQHFSICEKMGLFDKVEFVQTDLRLKDKTEDIMEGIDTCIHLAARIGGIGYFHKYPAEIISENNMMLSNVFDAAAKKDIKRLTYVSSSMVFESTDVYPSKEEHVKTVPMPKSAYGFSKLIGEKYCEAYNDQYGLDYTIVRPFNAYGINEFPKEVGHAHVIPDLIKKIMDGQYPLELLGSGEQSRCFTHVKDIADGMITASINKNGINQDFNISTDKETKIVELAKMIHKRLDDRPFMIKNVESFDCDVQRRIPDTSKAKDILGWTAKIDLEQGLSEVIDWMKEVYKK